MDMLHEAGVMNNTLVFFSSDNGGATYAKTKGFVCKKLIAFKRHDCLNV